MGGPAPLVVVTNRRARGIDGLDDGLSVLRAGAVVAVVDLSDRRGLEGRLAGPGAETLVVAGGDGTLHLLVQHLWDRGVLGERVVGLLPLGTGNDFARAVGLPLDPGAAAEVVLRGHPRSLDLLVDDAGRIAVNAVHCGVGGLAVRHAAPLKPLLGRLAYRVGAAWAGAKAPGWQVGVELDGRVLYEGRVLFVGAGNGTTIGGGSLVWPRARPDDAVADVVVAPAGTTLARLKVARALRAGAAEAADGVVTGRGTSLVVRGEPIPYVVDGEPHGALARRSWRAHPGAWRLLVPPAA